MANATAASQYGRYRWSATAADGTTQTREWQFWRTPTRMEISVGARREIWELQPDGKVWLAQINVLDKSFLEYAPIDAIALGHDQQWAKVHGLIDLAQLQQFRKAKLKTSEFGQAQSYRFEQADTRVDIAMLNSIGLPLAWKRKTALGTEQLELIELRDKAPAAHPATTEQTLSNYLRVDFTDIGDRENDPRVRRLIEAFVPGHLHPTLDIRAAIEATH